MSLNTVIPQGPFESKCRKQLSLSSCGWVLILSGQFKITQGPPGHPGDLGEKRTFSTSLREGPLLRAVRVLVSSGSSFLLVSG